MVNALIVGQKDNWMWFLMFPVKKSLSVIHAMLSLAFLICRLYKSQNFFRNSIGIYLLNIMTLRGEIFQEPKSDK